MLGHGTLGRFNVVENWATALLGRGCHGTTLERAQNRRPSLPTRFSLMCYVTLVGRGSWCTPPLFFPVGKHSWPSWTSVSSLVKWGPTTSRTGFSSRAQHAVLRQPAPSRSVPGGEMTVMERFLQGRRHGPDKTVFLLSLTLHNPVWGDCWKVGPGVEGG